MFYKFLFVFLIVGVANVLPEVIRVMNGNNVAEVEFPFVAFLSSTAGLDSCGCIILNDKWVLTVAHCVADNKAKPSTFYVQYGASVISKHSPQVANVKKIIVHENYTSKSHVNDIAVLRLEKPLTLSDKVKPVSLPKQSSEVPDNSKATLVGWGQDKEHLQKMDLITLSDEYCKKLYNGGTQNSQICAGVPKGGEGKCSGVSGGPLIVKGAVVGIFSWSGEPCNIAPYPGVYTKVSHFFNWIMKALIFNSY